MLNKSKYTERAYSRLFFLPLFLIPVLVFFPVAGYDFILLDDGVNIYENPFMASPSLESVLFFWTNPYEHLYIPATYTVWELLSAASRLITAAPLSADFRPGVFHSANLVVHLLSSFTLLYLLKRALSSSGQRESNVLIGALMGALFFSLHPLQVESVCWITEMKGLLSALFSLLSIHLYLSFLSAEKLQCKVFFYLAATTLFVFALLSKPSSLLLPCIIFILVTITTGTKKERLTPLIPWLFLLIPFAFITKTAQPDIAIDYVTPWYVRPFTAADALFFYIHKTLFPVNLGIDYGRSPEYLVKNWQISLPWIFYAGVFQALFLCRSRVPFLKYFFVTLFALLPVLGFVPFLFQKISTVADHYFYLAMIGPALLFSWVVTKTWDKTVWRYGAIVTLLLLAIQSSMQVRHWENSLSVFQKAIQVNPSSRLGHTNIGKFYYLSGNFSKARFHYQEALTNYPGDPVNLSNLGAVYFVSGRTSEAVKTFEKAIAIDSDFLVAHQNLSRIFEKLGRHDKALLHAEESLRIDRKNPKISERVTQLRNLPRSKK